MKRYQLVEKSTNKGQSRVLQVKSVKNRYLFSQYDCLAFPLGYYIDFMVKKGLVEMDLWLAERSTNSPYFYCQHYGEVGERSEGSCGKICKEYKPRNGKSGICKNYGYTYEPTDRCFTLKLLD